MKPSQHFPYVNGELFDENLGFADFNRDMRNALLACTHFDWSRISPAIFGSLFQAIMEPRERRQIGGHYTNERDILKVVRSLFLDDLRTEFERAKNNKAELRRFHEKLAGLRFLDPACGCGNFLVVTYRELRALEIETLKLIHDVTQPKLNIQELSLVDVDAFYGIEISEWPARIAEVAMWLMDHQMNIRLSEAFGQYFVRLPLKKSPTIVWENALRLDWGKVLPPDRCSFVLGNPPFVGKQYMTDSQNEDMSIVCGNVKGHGLLDYVTAWYFKAAEYIQGTRVVVGFVSTNSITQGEQVGILWNALFRLGIKIHFGHRTFPWESEARGKAHVHVVILGFGNFDTGNKRIYDYEGDKVTVTNARNISPYLVEGNDRVVTKRSTSISRAPEIVFGSMPNDGGHLLLSEDEKRGLLARDPAAAKFVKPFLGSEEFINGIPRWCLWLVDASPQDLRAMPEVMKRVEAVKEQRLKSSRGATRNLARVPTLFGEIRQPSRRYLAIPEVSSERRSYIPIAFLNADIIASNKLYTISEADLFTFGVLSSAMHMAWVRQVSGRLESRYQYSGKVVYNNFSFPERPAIKQRDAVEAAAQAVLDARKEFRDATLGDLYDPLTMPPALVKAHSDLDRAVDLCYRPQPFENERQRVEYLFALYEKLTAPLIAPAKKGRRKRKDAA